MAPSKTETRPVAVQFIVTTTLDKTDADTRKFIRSHVMRGKNKGKKRPTKANKQACPLSSTVSEDDHSPPEPKTTESKRKAWVPPRPRMVATDMDLCEMTSALGPNMKDLISKAFNVVKPATFATELFGRPSDSSDLFCFSNLSLHPSMIPSLLFTAQAYHDILTTSAVSDKAQMYLAQALRQLQQTLADGKTATAYSTMVVVASLATGSLIAGDLETAKKHLDGLHHILGMRGGIQSLQKGGMIEYKAQSMDLALHMGLGTPPRFLRPDITYDPTISPLEHPSISPHFPELSPLRTSAVRYTGNGNTLQCLINAYADCRSFSDTADAVRRNGRFMQPALFVQLGRNVTYRLLHLPEAGVREGLGTGTGEELLRLGMLSFIKTVLIRASWIGKRMVFMKAQVEETLKTRLAGPVLEWPKLLLWGLWIARLAVLGGVSSDPRDHLEWVVMGMKRTINALGLDGWEEVKAVLKEFLWIDVLHDDEGRRIYQSLGMGGEADSDDESSFWLVDDAQLVARKLGDENMSALLHLTM